MAGIIAPGVCRYTIHGTYAGNEVANVIDMAITPAPGTARALCILDQGARIISAWVDEVLDQVANNYEATLLSYVDLNSADGIVGSFTIGIGSDFPANGALSGDPMPGNVAYRINKSISAVRGQRKGRMYLVGVPESITTDAAPNTVAPATQAAVTTSLQNFMDAINVAAGGTPDYVSSLQVVHTAAPAPGEPPVYTGQSPVNGLTCDATLASQRRRLRR